MPTNERRWTTKVAELSSSTEVFDLAIQINKLAETLGVNTPILLEALNLAMLSAKSDDYSLSENID